MANSNQPLAGRAVVFDLDGTLVDTAPDLLGALNHALETIDVEPVGLDQVRDLIGQGAKAMLRQGLALRGRAADAPETAEALWPSFLDHYKDHIADQSRPYPHAVDALDALAEAGAVLAVCTNKTQALSERLLDALGLAPRFAAIVGADAVPARKPDPGHLRAAAAQAGAERGYLLIGDSETDALAAEAAGAPFVFCPFGYGPKPKDGVRVDAVLDDYRFLPAVAGRLFS